MFVVTTHLPDAYDPFKDPGWRWQRCNYLLDYNRQPLQDLDDAVTGLSVRGRPDDAAVA
jgi:hypothetical protein